MSDIAEEVATECIYCGGYIHAGQYPPLCSDYCILWCDYEVAFSKWAKEQGDKL